MTASTLLRGACVLTLGAKTSNFNEADVLIDDGGIAEVGQRLRARDAEVVDAAETIVMPGFVDTHRHAWTSLLRNLGEGGSNGHAASPASSFAAHYGADDVYAATLVGLLGAIEAGITTVVDWSDVSPSDEVAEAALRAHADAGLRTVYVHVPRPGEDPGPALSRLAEAAGPRTTVALGAVLSGSATEGMAAAWSAARERGLQIHAHLGHEASSAVESLAAEGLLGEDVTLVHCGNLDGATLDSIAASGARVSLAPSSEMAGGVGSPPVQELIDRGVRPGLGVDQERVAPGDLFAQMRATISLQHMAVFELKLAGKAGLPRLMTTRDVIRYATVDGARVAGVGGAAGSLEPGKRADLIVLRTDRPNIFPINDPIGAVVWGMDTSNLDRVFVDGRSLMRGGLLEGDVERARELAREAQGRVAAASGLVGGAAGGEG